MLPLLSALKTARPGDHPMTTPHYGRMLLTGASGLVGKAIAIRWRAAGGEIIELAHQPRPNALTWHPEKGEMPAKALEGR